jgi:hypothetical protein
MSGFGLYTPTPRRPTWQVLMIPAGADDSLWDFGDALQAANFLSRWVSRETANDAVESANLYGHARIG